MTTSTSHTIGFWVKCFVLGFIAIPIYSMARMLVASDEATNNTTPEPQATPHVTLKDIDHNIGFETNRSAPVTVNMEPAMEKKTVPVHIGEVGPDIDIGFGDEFKTHRSILCYGQIVLHDHPHPNQMYRLEVTPDPSLVGTGVNHCQAVFTWTPRGVCAIQFEMLAPDLSSFDEPMTIKSVSHGARIRLFWPDVLRAHSRNNHGVCWDLALSNAMRRSLGCS